MTGKTLFCFHHAGGTEWQFRTWKSRVHPSVKVVGVPLEDRLARKETIENLALNALERMQSFNPESTAIYGHSMGGLVAYEVCRRIHAAGANLPARVIIGGTAAPGYLEAEEVLGALRAQEHWPTCIPGYVVERTEAGVRRACLYEPPTSPLPVQLDVITGSKDEIVGSREVSRWSEYCVAPPRFHEVSGGHLFHHSNRGEFMKLLCQIITGQERNNDSISSR